MATEVSIQSSQRHFEVNRITLVENNICRLANIFSHIIKINKITPTNEIIDSAL